MTAQHMIAPGQYNLKEWTPERVAHAARLWMEGFSAHQISRALGGVSRNAVIGKMHRLRMPGHTLKVRSAPLKIKRVKPQSQARLAELYRQRYAPPKIPAEPLSAVEELVIPLAERKTIQTLVECSCRWPIGDPQQADFHFCGKSKVAGLPYCEFHARRAFQPPQVRRRENVKPMLSLAMRFGVARVAEEFDHA